MRARGPAPLTRAQVAALPKVLLHDHLDGGVRPSTLLELGEVRGHQMPAQTPQELAAWFVQASSAGSLESYLGTFEHTLAVTQTAEDLTRVSREAVIDLAADGVVLAELRYAPEQHQRGGLEMQGVVDAVRAGLEDGVADVASGGGRIRVAQILIAMRHASRSTEVAQLALANRHKGVVGMDLAGAEVGHPVDRHRKALRLLRNASFPVTIHAGEAGGVSSIAEALHLGGALRLGHGVRLVDDIRFGPSTAEDPYGLAHAELGDVAHWVRDLRIPLELCPTSNVQTGAARDHATHPITALAQLGFTVTVSTDNRLQSGTSPTEELWRLVEHAGWGIGEIEAVTVAAAEHAFAHHDERRALIEDVLLPAFRPDGARRRRGA